jgi:hypothetical protein
MFLTGSLPAQEKNSFALLNEPVKKHFPMLRAGYAATYVSPTAWAAGSKYFSMLTSINITELLTSLHFLTLSNKVSINFDQPKKTC